MLKKIELDFSNITKLEQMHQLLKEKFGFPGFYGCNGDALIDCWSELRVSKDSLCSNVNLGKSETLILECKNLASKNKILIREFLGAVSAVNEREISRGNTPSLFICPIEI